MRVLSSLLKTFPGPGGPGKRRGRQGPAGAGLFARRRRQGVGEPVAGGGLSTGGVLLRDAPGVGETAGVTEPVGVAEGLTDRDRDGEDEGVGDGSGEVVAG